MSVSRMAHRSDICLATYDSKPIELSNIRAVAQLGSALVWGTRGRGFKSRQPDQLNSMQGVSVLNLHVKNLS